MSGSGQSLVRTALTQEHPVDPHRPIIDAHHHLWAEGQGLGGGPTYLHAQLLADIAGNSGTGHNVVGSVYVESGTAWRKDGPEELKSLGETEFAAEEAKRSAASCSPVLGIVAFADLTLGDRVQGIIDAHAAAGTGLLRGVRQHCGRDPSMSGSGPKTDLLTDPEFRKGLDCLGSNGYSFDAFVFHPQLPDLTRLAQSVPGTTFVLNHFGVPLNRDPNTPRADVMEAWRAGMLKLSACDNIVIKIGGIGLDSLFGMGWSKRDRQPTSDEVAAWWGDDLTWCIDTFGPSRCLFESNFPIDRRSMSYSVLWNAFQKIAARYSNDEQNALFAVTARRVYRLDLAI